MDQTKKVARKTALKTKKSDIVAHVSNHEISGLGENVVKVIDVLTGENICYIGIIDGEEKVYFGKTTNLAQIEAVANLLHKKKFNKLLTNGNIDKAQSYAEKKLKLPSE